MTASICTKLFTIDRNNMKYHSSNILENFACEVNVQQIVIYEMEIHIPTHRYPRDFINIHPSFQSISMPLQCKKCIQCNQSNQNMHIYMPQIPNVFYCLHKQGTVETFLDAGLSLCAWNKFTRPVPLNAFCVPYIKRFLSFKRRFDVVDSFLHFLIVTSRQTARRNIFLLNLFKYHLRKTSQCVKSENRCAF